MSAAQDSLNLFFTITFTVELLLNLYAQWFQPFFRDGWNMLDLVIVAISLIGLAPVDLPVSLVLSLRAIRVVRLFGKVKSLRKMLTALSMSIPPLMNAYTIIFVIAGICESSRSIQETSRAAIAVCDTRDALFSLRRGSQIQSWACICSGGTIRSTLAPSHGPWSPCFSLQVRPSPPADLPSGRKIQSSIQT